MAIENRKSDALTLYNQMTGSPVTEDIFRIAQQLVDDLSERDNLNHIDMQLLTTATNLLESRRSEERRLNINEANIKDLVPIYKQLTNMDVESHESVIDAQKVLKKHGYYADQLDSLYGPATKEARIQMEDDIRNHPQFLVNMVMDQARGLFENWNK
jgi:hypothetical protein